MTLLRRAALAALVLGIAGGCATLDSKQSEWIFRPVRDNWRGYQGVPSGVEEVWLRVPSAPDEKVHGWWSAQADPHAPVVLYLHGARWNLTGSSFRIERWRAMGFAVLAIDYRGFGQSSGELPTERKAYEDAALAWEWLKARVPEASRRFIYGHSLGGAIAADLAAKLPAGEAAGLITESTFTSVPDVVAASRYGWLPVGFLITQRFEVLERMRKVAMPKLIMHGTADSVIPHEMADTLYAAASEPKQLVKFEGASHSGIAWGDFERYRETVAAFVRSAGAAASTRHTQR